MRTVKFYTLGCKVNQYDTQSIRERFIQAGFKELRDGLPADIYLLNTCTVTSLADQKSRKLIQSLNRENPDARIIVTGCLVERDAQSISDMAEVDFIIAKRFFPEGIKNFSNHTRAFLKIQDGCENFCSYCKVPLVRGNLRSKPLDKIMQEAEELLKNGFKEIVLTGICLGAYGRDIAGGLNLVKVIDNLEGMQGLLRIRLSSIEPGDVSDALIERIKKSHKLCRHLHIPLQSGDDEILKKMNRNYSHHIFLGLIHKIRDNIPEIAITTDVLVGFPAETENNFKNTISLIKKIMPLKVHIFPYSTRAGTAASRDFKHVLAPSLIKQRVAYLKHIAYHCSSEYKKRFLNKEVDVLIEGTRKGREGFQQGYTDTYIKVLVKADTDLKNRLIKVRLLQLTGDVMVAQIQCI